MPTRRAMGRASSRRGLAPEDLRGRLVEAWGQPVCGEGTRDLLHLADPAPALLLGRALGCCQAVRELRLRARPLGAERLLDALGAREISDREDKRGRSLRPRGVRALERRCIRDELRLDRRAVE